MLQLTHDDIRVYKYIVFPTREIASSVKYFMPLICIEAINLDCSAWEVNCGDHSVLSKYENYFVLQPLGNSKDSENFNEFRYDTIEEALDRFNEWLLSEEAAKFIYARYRIKLNEIEKI